MAEHNFVGQAGEKAARAYLEKNGYRTRHVNWRCGHLELDIVAETDTELIVIEVKTRSTRFFGNPEAAVTPAKIRRIINATQGYLRTYQMDREVRFDVMSLVPGEHEGEYLIEHIENAFVCPIW